MPVVNYKSVFDIIGPVMIGPSSSHTAGAVAIGKAAHDIFEETPSKIVVHYYESFAETHLGHGTDYAIISGILGFAPDDARVPEAVKIAEDQGIQVTFIEETDDSPIKHPNTAIIELTSPSQSIEVAGCSIGGGTIEIRGLKFDGYTVEPSGALPIMLVALDDDVNETTFKDEVTCLSAINHEKAYSNQKQTLYEFDLDSRLKEKQIADLRKNAKKLIYI